MRPIRLPKIDRLLPPVFISSVALFLTFGAVPNLIVQKLCSPHGQPSINDFICNDTAMVAEATSITTSGGTIRSVISAVTVAFFGAWRDATGRNKPLLLIGELSQALCALIYLVASWNWSSSPWLSVLLEAVLGGAFGIAIRGLASHCLIIESSKPEERTMKLQLFMTSAFVAALVSSLIRVILLPSVGYTWFFAVVAGLHLLATAMFTIGVQDTKKQVTKKNQMDTLTKIKTAFKPRPNGLVVWLMIICKPLIHSYFSAEHMIGMYFLQQGFHFTVNEETVYGTFGLILGILGSFTMPLLLTKVLKLSDFGVGIASSSLTSLAALLTAFATTKTHLYYITLLNILKQLLFSIPESILSKCVKSDELGEICLLGLFSGFSSVLGVFLPFGVNQLYNKTFAATSKTMPGAIFLISAAGNIIVTALFCMSAYSFTAPKKEKSEEEEKKSEVLDDQNLKKVD